MPDVNDGSLTDSQLDGIAAGVAELTSPDERTARAPSTSTRGAIAGTKLELHWRGKAPSPCVVHQAKAAPEEIAAGMRQVVDVKTIREDGTIDQATTFIGVRVYDRLGDAERESLVAAEPDLLGWAEFTD